MAKKKKRKKKGKAVKAKSKRKKVRKAKAKKRRLPKRKKVLKRKKTKKTKKRKSPRPQKAPTPSRKKTAGSRKPVKSKQAPVLLPWRDALPGERFVGVVEDYFSHVGVLASTLKDRVQIGNRLHVRGHTTDLVMELQSMQIEHQPVSQAGPGDSIGIKVSQRVRKGDYIYTVK